MQQLEFSMSIRTLVMEQLEKIFRMAEYTCDAITGDGSRSVNTYSKLQHVCRPDHGLLNHCQSHCQGIPNALECDRRMPIEDRLDISMETSRALKAIIRHILHMKTGSGYDRTFPDCMVAFTFSRNSGRASCTCWTMSNWTKWRLTPCLSFPRAIQAHQQRNVYEWLV